MRHPLFAWLLLAAYAALLFFQSSLPAHDMGPDFPGQDKLLHLAAYALMSWLACCAFGTLRGLRSRWAVCLTGLIFALVFGLSDEWHQSFVPARCADGWDLVADGLGALAGAALYGWRRRARTTAGPTFPR